MIECVNFDRTTHQAPHWRFEAGTGSIGDAVGLGRGNRLRDRRGHGKHRPAEHEMLDYGTPGLLTVPGLRIIGTAVTKAAVMCFDLEGHKAEDVGSYVDSEGIAVLAGHHCASRFFAGLG